MALTASFCRYKGNNGFYPGKRAVLTPFFVGIKESTAFNWKISGVNGV